MQPHSSDQLFFCDRWHVLTSKLADISRWLWMDSKITICRNMLHRLRQRPSAFKGHGVARGGINKGDATYVGIAASSHGLRHPQELPQTHGGDCSARKTLTSWRLNGKELWWLCNSSQACHVCVIKLLLIRSEFLVMDCPLINTWLIFEWKWLYCLATIVSYKCGFQPGRDPPCRPANGSFPRREWIFLCLTGEAEGEGEWRRETEGAAARCKSLFSSGSFQASLTGACFPPERQMKVFLGHSACEIGVMSFADKLFMVKMSRGD